MVQIIAQPPTDAASTMRMVMVVRGRLEPPIWALSAFDDEEAAGTWLVSVTESTETDWPLMGVCVTCAPFCGDGTRAFDVEEGRREELDEVALEVVVVELLELTKLTLDVAEADETCCLGHQYLEIQILIKTIHQARSQQRGW
jgi:hypothetical protein